MENLKISLHFILLFFIKNFVPILYPVYLHGLLPLLLLVTLFLQWYFLNIRWGK